MILILSFNFGLVFIIIFHFPLQTTMISLEALPKVIDSSQLTPDLDGTLQYDHAQWIDLRLVRKIKYVIKYFFFVFIYFLYNNCDFNFRL